MPRMAANLSMLFGELPLLERIGAAAAAGFAGVEILFPYDLPVADVRAALYVHRVPQVLVNLPPGDAAKGERGRAAQPGREAEFWADFERALAYAVAVGCPRLHVLSGNLAAGRGQVEHEVTLIANLRRAAERAAQQDITLTIEPLNPVDQPDYFLHTTGQALGIIEKVARPNVTLQLDLYHCQIAEGNLAAHIRGLVGHYGHVQFAGVPGRVEPDLGEVNYPYLLAELDAVGYSGWVSAEYRPVGETLAGLGWLKRWGLAKAAWPP